MMTELNSKLPAEQHVDPAPCVATNDDQDALAASREEEEREIVEAVNQRTIDHDQIKVLRQLTVQQIDEMDVPLRQGVDFFFQNQVVDCERMLNMRIDKDPLAMCGGGLVAFLRYALSLEQEQSNLANERLSMCSAFAQQLLPSKGNIVTKGFSKLFNRRSNPSSNWLSAADFRSKTIYAECHAVRGIGLFVQNTIPSIVKGGLALHRSYNAYEELSAELEKRLEVKRAELRKEDPNAASDSDLDVVAIEQLGLDRDSVHSVEFGLGAINIAIASLPANVRSILRHFGFSGDRAQGFKQLERCFRSNTLLSPFASALLLCIECVMSGSCALLVQESVAYVEKFGAEVLQRPNTKHSLLHLFLLNRSARLSRNIEASIKELDHCLDIGDGDQLREALPQLRDFVVYDQMFNYFITRQWRKAMHFCCYLRHHSKFSPMFYLYVQGACKEILEMEKELGVASAESDAEPLFCNADGSCAYRTGDPRAPDSVSDPHELSASELYWLAAQQSYRMLGGKPNNMEQFVMKRLHEMLNHANLPHPNPTSKYPLKEPVPLPEGAHFVNTVPLAIYEVITMFSSSLVISKRYRGTMLHFIDHQLQNETAVEGSPLMDCVDAAKIAVSMPHSVPTAVKALENNSYHAAVTPRRSGSSKLSGGALPPNYRVLGLCTTKAILLSNSEFEDERALALPIIEAVLATPKYKDRAWTLSYAQPFLLYAKVCILYQDGDRGRAAVLLKELHSEYDSAHYFLHARLDIRAHLASGAVEKNTVASSSHTKGKSK